MRIYQLFLALILGFIVISCQPEDKRQLKMSPLFSDHMVLQQNQDIAFWGEYSPMKKITLSGSWGDEATTESDANGQWKMTLTSPAAGGPYSINVISADSTIMIDDVLFGEVWLASGQSNMEMPLKGWPPNDPIANSSEEISNANYPNIRMFTVARNLSGAPLDTIRGQWVASSPETAGDFSASAYFLPEGCKMNSRFPLVLSTVAGEGPLLKPGRAQLYSGNWEILIRNLMPLKNPIPLRKRLTLSTDLTN